MRCNSVGLSNTAAILELSPRLACGADGMSYAPGMNAATRPPTTHLLYLHGFRSSPQSAKAQRVAARVAAQHPSVVWWCPQLPPSPAEAMRLLMSGTADWPSTQMVVIGSSLGGFYARAVALQKAC